MNEIIAKNYLWLISKRYTLFTPIFFSHHNVTYMATGIQYLKLTVCNERYGNRVEKHIFCFIFTN